MVTDSNSTIERTREMLEERQRDKPRGASNIPPSPRIEFETKKQFAELRQDMNVLAQHLKSLRTETQEKFDVLSKTSNNFEKNALSTFEAFKEGLDGKDAAAFAKVVERVIKEDNVASRKQLFEDIERFFDGQIKKSSSKTSFSKIQWTINIILFLGFLIVLFLVMKG